MGELAPLSIVTYVWGLMELKTEALFVLCSHMNLLLELVVAVGESTVTSISTWLASDPVLAQLSLYLIFKVRCN